MTRAILFLFLFIPLINCSWAQTDLVLEADLIKKEAQAKKYFEEGNIIDGIILSKEIIALADLYNHTDHKFNAYIIYAKFNIVAANYELSEKYLKKSESLFDESDTNGYMSQIIFLRATVRAQLGEFDKAIEIFSELHSKALVKEDYDFAMKIVENIGACYIQLSEYDSALYYTEQLINLKGETTDYNTFCNLLQNKAYILMEMNRLDSVLTILNSSIKIAKDIESIELESEGIFLLGYYSFLIGDLDNTLQYLEQSSRLIEAKGQIETEQYIADLYFELYSKMGNYKEALFWYKKKEVLKDSVSNKGYRTKLALAEINHQIRETELELSLQTNKLSNTKNIIIALFIGLLLLLMIFAMQWRLLKFRKKNSLSLQQKNEEIAVQNEELEQQQLYLMDQNNYIENRNVRFETFLSQLEKLTNSFHINKGEKKKAFQEICLLTQDCLSVSRVSIWRYSSSEESITRETMLDGGEFTDKPGTYFEKDYPKYFGAIRGKLIITADDVMTDPATSEFIEGYETLNIKSMIDAPFLFNGEFAGIICCEQKEEIKKWNSEDTIFLKSLSDFISITLHAEQHQNDNRKLKISNDSLEEMVSKRTLELEEQNKQLREYAFINSHLLRAPLARVLGLSFLISKEATSIKDKELVSTLLSSADELDHIVKGISDILYDANNLKRDDILDIIGKKLDIK